MHDGDPGAGPPTRRSPRARQSLDRARARVAHLGRLVRPWWLALGILLLLGSLVAVGVGIGYQHYARDLPSIEGFGTASLSQVTRIFASDGKTLLEERYRENRTVVDLSHISRELQDATIATEDRDFYSHKGVDIVRVAAAAVFDLTHGRAAQGASTITQQVVKTSVLKAPERSLSRKIKELILSTQLEAHYSKTRILEMYLNSIYYGHSAYGIEAASETYFHLHAKDLALPEATFLAGLPQSPSRYDPLTPDGYVAARARQRTVLHSMVTAGFISQSAADVAEAKDLQLELKTATAQGEAPRSGMAPHFVDYVLNLLDQRYGQDLVNRSGFTVVTTLDPHAQQLATQAVQDEVAAVQKVTRVGPNPDGFGIGQAPNDGAALVLSPRTGAILAMVGSRDYNDKSINGARNMVVDEPRQVGSSFKTYTYATALANGYTPESTLLDAGGNFPGFVGNRVSDFDGRELGPISLAYSIQQSRNISSVRLFQALGARRVFATAEALGIPPAALHDAGLAATLGVNPLRMIDHVAAYAGFANGGRRVIPWAIVKITDSSGHVIEDNKPPHMAQAIPAHVAFEVNQILKGAERPSGWNLNIPFANKSGTTEHWWDSWYVGYTTDLTMGVWMAHVDDKFSLIPQHVIYGENGAGLIMRDFMKAWYAGSSPPDFTESKPADPCKVVPSPSPGPRQTPSGRPGATPTPSGRTSVPQAPYQYGDAGVTSSGPLPGLSVSPCPSPTSFPERPGAGGTTPTPAPGPTPPEPVITEPTPTPRPPSRPSPTPCPILNPLCH
ncbi:MAG: transglycosylase domain-containing protein [Candidatus Dormibacteria bacterium]